MTTPRTWIVVFALLLGACNEDATDSSIICSAAVQGVGGDRMSLETSCENDVFVAEFKAAHAAAQKYRNMPQ